MSEEPSSMIRRADELLASNDLDDATVDALCELLRPAGQKIGIDLDHVEGVLYVAEHPAIAGAFDSDEVPPELEAALAESIGATSRILGEWTGAPFAAQVDRIRRRFDREEKKYEMVRNRLLDDPDDTGVTVLGSYLDTDPAPLFVRRLASEFATLYDRAQKQRGVSQATLVGDDRLLELLCFDPSMTDDDEDELAERLDALADEIDDLDATVVRAIERNETDSRLVASFLAVDRELSDAAHGLLMVVARGEPHAAQAAVCAGRLAPSLARQVLAGFLVDVLNDSTPTEDREVDEDALRRAIVAARTVLPLIGSPVDEIEQIDATAEAVAGRVRRAWEFCEIYA